MNFKKIKAAVLTCAIGMGFSAGAYAENVFEVSTKSGEYNEILLTQPFVDALFNNKAAVKGKVVILNNNKNFLFKLKPTVTEELQLFIVMSDGTRKKIRLVPNPEIKGQTWPKESVAANKNEDLVGFQTPKSKQYYIDLLKEVYEAKSSPNGDRPVPSGYMEESATDISYYGPLLVREIKRFSNTNNRISVYSLSSNSPVNVTPADFYRDDVVAVELNYDVIGQEEVTMVVISKEKER